MRVKKAQDTEGYVDGVASALRENATLKHLEFCNNHFPAGSFRKIFQAVLMCNKLESLCIDNETLSGDDTRALRSLLEKSSRIKMLKFVCINEESISMVISGVLEGCPLEELHICVIEYASAVHKSLAMSFTGILGNIRILTLRCTDIKDDLAINLARHLTQNSSLKHLDLSSNSIGEAGQWR